MTKFVLNMWCVLERDHDRDDVYESLPYTWISVCLSWTRNPGYVTDVLRSDRPRDLRGDYCSVRMRIQPPILEDPSLPQVHWLVSRHQQSTCICGQRQPSNIYIYVWFNNRFHVMYSESRYTHNKWSSKLACSLHKKINLLVHYNKYPYIMDAFIFN